MNLYDDIIQDVLGSIEGLPTKNLEVTCDIDSKDIWPDAGKAKVILRSEMAYELGSEKNSAVGYTITTTNNKIVPADRITLIGPDLPEIKQNCSYARIALVRVSDKNLGEGDELYNAIHGIEYFRYHIYPEGFMLRVSAASNRESVRVGTNALEQGLNFQKIGNFMLRALHSKKDVEAANVIFITLPNAPFERLQADAAMTKKITNTIDHMLKDVKMDCDTCNLQGVCDEVEGLKELHFGISNAK